MSPQYDFGIMGGDLRQVSMTVSFLRKGFKVASYHISEPVNHLYHSMVPTLEDLLEKCSIIIGPVPMSRDQVTIHANNTVSDLTISNLASLISKDHILIGGNLPDQILKICEANHISYYDLMKDEKVTILNAIATAEGAIMEAIAGSNYNLHKSICLVLGYGRCAKVLAQKLKGLDAQVTVAARSEEALAYAEAAGHATIPLSNLNRILPSCQYIFNTIPSQVLDQDCLELVNKNVTIIDIASAPGGVDFEYAKKLKLNAKLCLGLPGKVAPVASAEILVTQILAFLSERKK